MRGNKVPDANPEEREKPEMITRLTSKKHLYNEPDEQAQEAPQPAFYMTINGQQVDQATVHRLMSRKSAQIGDGKGCATRPFTILR